MSDEVRLVYKWKDLIKHVKKFSFWKGSEVLKNAKKICDKQKQELISEFVNDLILMKEYPENDIRDLIKKWEEKLK